MRYSGRRLPSRLLALVAAFPAIVLAEKSTHPPERTLNLPAREYRYADPRWPAYFADAGVPAYDTTPSNNPITDAGATLGRVLFYDTRLSASGTIACASCHIQAHSFAEPRRLSVGHRGQATDRNAMALNDLRFARAGLFWDERAPSLEDAVMAPLYSHVEMGMTPGRLVATLQADDRYPPLFEAAFGSLEPSPDRVGRALAQFIRAIASTNSRYDQCAPGARTTRDDFPGFTRSENLGKRLFLDKCALCHHLGDNDRIAIFSMFRSLNNGLDPDADARDGGRGDITYNPSDVGLFRASSLRNVEYTPPYMHDGRLATLEDVLEHYSEGVHRHPTVGPVHRMRFSTEERTAIIDFLKTLSDPALLVDERFSNPWSVEPATAPRSALGHSEKTHHEPPRDAFAIADRLTAGVGIEPAETLVYLHSLDTDGDQALSMEELAPLTRVLARLEVSTVPRQRSLAVGARRPRTAATASRSSGGATDSVSAPPSGQTETPEAALARRETALKRLFEMEDGGRLDVFIDRLLRGPGLSREQAQRLRESIRAAKGTLNERRLGQNRETARRLAELLGPEAFDRFRSRVVDSQVVREDTGIASDSEVAEVAAELTAQDRDRSGKLEDEEIQALAKALDQAPGGFGQARAPAVDIRLFAHRILRFDADGDGLVEPEDLPERLRPFAIEGDANHDGELSLTEASNHFRSAAFGRLLETGIYVGGAFENTLVKYDEILDELKLAPETLTRAHRLIQTHERRLAEESSEFLDEPSRLLRSFSRGERSTAEESGLVD